MKSNVKLCILAVAAVVVVVAGVGVRGAADRSEPANQSGAELSAIKDSGDGRKYINALAEALQGSDRIVVTEHSNVDDIL